MTFFYDSSEDFRLTRCKNDLTNKSKNPIHRVQAINTC